VKTHRCNSKQDAHFNLPRSRKTTSIKQRNAPLVPPSSPLRAFADGTPGGHLQMQRAGRSSKLATPAARLGRSGRAAAAAGHGRRPANQTFAPTPAPTVASPPHRRKCRKARDALIGRRINSQAVLPPVVAPYQAKLVNGAEINPRAAAARRREHACMLLRGDDGPTPAEHRNQRWHDVRAPPSRPMPQTP
jgi:hypothetical protein